METDFLDVFVTHSRSGGDIQVMMEWVDLGPFPTSSNSIWQMTHLVLAENNSVRIFWAFLVIISLAAFVYLLIITLRNYLAYDTDVNLDVCLLIFMGKQKQMERIGFHGFYFAAQIWTIPIFYNNCMQCKSIQIKSSASKSRFECFGKKIKRSAYRFYLVCFLGWALQATSCTRTNQFEITN